MNPAKQKSVEKMFYKYCMQALKHRHNDIINSLRQWENDRSLYSTEVPAHSSGAECWPIWHFAVNGVSVDVGDDELAWALMQLKPQQADILLLYYIAGFRDAEIARAMKRCASAIQASRTRSLERIKRYMKNEKN